MVLHPGSAVGLTKEEALENIADALNIILEKDYSCKILLETMAGKGTECGCTTDELKYIIDKVNCQNQIGVCLDTCHIFDGGYDISNFDLYLNEFDEKIGINKIGCIHVNDSKNILGSHKDRHANIGTGNIGFNNLKAYGTSLGGKVILTGGDKFGNQTVEDTNIYLKEAYRIINKDKEYGPFLLEIMNNNDHNAFNKEGINIYHKYGSWDINFHDIGLNLEGSPYAISVFTTHGFSNYKEVIQDIHDAVRKLNDTFVKYRENKCYEEIYNS